MYRRLTFSFSLFYNFSRPELVEFSCLEGQSDEIFDPNWATGQFFKNNSELCYDFAQFFKVLV